MVSMTPNPSHAQMPQFDNPYTLTPTYTHTLIFEPLRGGHRTEFLQHLLDGIRQENRSDHRYTLVLAKGLVSGELPEQVNLVEVSEEDSLALNRASGMRGTFIFLRVLKRYVKQLKPDRLLILELTHLELPLCFWRPPCPLRGILFVQYPELRFHEQAWKQDFRRRLHFFWKEFKTGLFLRKVRPERIFLLNGEKSCSYLNQRFQVSCYQSLPDPLMDISPEPEFSIRQVYEIEQNRRIFLFFGSISSRKGVEPLLDAMMKLSAENAQNAAFLFCGKPESSYADRYRKLIQTFRKKRPDICLRVKEAFVSSERMRALFEQADWILMPYARPEYSSGILAHAASAKTPVMVSDDGLIARQVRAYALGETVSESEWTNALANGVKLNYEMNEVLRKKFVEQSSSSRFAELLLK